MKVGRGTESAQPGLRARMPADFHHGLLGQSVEVCSDQTSIHTLQSKRSGPALQSAHASLSRLARASPPPFAHRDRRGVLGLRRHRDFPSRLAVPDRFVLQCPDHGTGRRHRRRPRRLRAVRPHSPGGQIDRRAPALDRRTRHSVQTGDVPDRGADSRKVFDLLRRLTDEAAKAGGRVHALLGNHEVMRMMGDYRYVSQGEYAAFRSLNSEVSSTTTTPRPWRLAGSGPGPKESGSTNPRFGRSSSTAHPSGSWKCTGRFRPRGSMGAGCASTTQWSRSTASPSCTGVRPSRSRGSGARPSTRRFPRNSGRSRRPIPTSSNPDGRTARPAVVSGSGGWLAECGSGRGRCDTDRTHRPGDRGGAHRGGRIPDPFPLRREGRPDRHRHARRSVLPWRRRLRPGDSGQHVDGDIRRTARNPAAVCQSGAANPRAIDLSRGEGRAWSRSGEPGVILDTFFTWEYSFRLTIYASWD